MKEIIILAPGANKSELLRMLAKYGKNTMGLRVLNRIELAKHALMKSGVLITEEFLTTKEEPSVIFSFLNEIDYFKAASYADAESLSSAIAMMRSLVFSDEENVLNDRLAAGEFPVKNEAVLEVYRRFIQKTTDDGRIDGISLVREAIEKANSLPDVEFLILKEYPLMPIDTALITKLSNGSFKGTSLIDLTGREKTKLSEISFTEGYGSINEVERILDEIFRTGISLDKCVIAAANTSAYSQMFYDLACCYGIPITYGSGIPILNSNPARLLKLIYEWSTVGYYGIDSLRKIITSDAFDRRELAVTLGLDDEVLKRRDAEELIKMAGSIRLSFKAAENKQRLNALKVVLDKEAAEARNSGNYKAIKNSEYRQKVYDWTKKLSDELALGCIEFLSKYVLIRTNEPDDFTNISEKIDQSAISVITETLSAFMHYAPDGDINEIIPDLLQKTVCSENSRAGCIHVTSISGAISCMRENLYICGLDATDFPGSPSENYLLLDSDFLLLADCESAPTSENRVRNKVRSFFDLLDLAAALGANTHLSYSSYSLSELKDHNPSSVLFSTYEMMCPDAGIDDFKNDVIQAPYFGSAISSDRLIGEEYSKGAEFIYTNASADIADPSEALKKAWSPSALSNFLQCPRHFYLANILGIPEEESDDPFEILNAAVTGTLAHTMMEKLGDNDYSRQEFLEMSSAVFDDALGKRPPIHPSDAAALKRDFMKMMETSFNMDPRNQVVSAEEEYRFEHPSGINIHGYPDRVERDEEGRYLIADYKTKRKIDHVQDDFSTCMQVIVYAWLCEQAGINISSCEYRYLRKGRTVTCKYDDEMKEQLNEFLVELRSAIEDKDFPRIESTDNCKYCKMADICKWPIDSEREEVGEDE